MVIKFSKSLAQYYIKIFMKDVRGFYESVIEKVSVKYFIYYAHVYITWEEKIGYLLFELAFKIVFC